MHMLKAVASFLQIIIFLKVKEISPLWGDFGYESVNPSGHLDQKVSASSLSIVRGTCGYNMAAGFTEESQGLNQNFELLDIH